MIGNRSVAMHALASGIGAAIAAGQRTLTGEILKEVCGADAQRDGVIIVTSPGSGDYVRDVVHSMDTAGLNVMVVEDRTGTLPTMEQLFPPEPKRMILTIAADCARQFAEVVDFKPRNQEPFYAKFRKRESKKSRHRRQGR